MGGMSREVNGPCAHSLPFARQSGCREFPVSFPAESANYAYFRRFPIDKLDSRERTLSVANRITGTLFWESDDQSDLQLSLRRKFSDHKPNILRSEI